MNRLVFVYGTLMKGHGNHSLLCHVKFIGKATTVGEYVLSASGIPFVTNEPNHPLATHIKGELYAVGINDFGALDSLEGHPRFYERKEVSVWVIRGDWMPAWLYFHPIQGNVIRSGDYNDYCKPKLNEVL